MKIGKIAINTTTPAVKPINNNLVQKKMDDFVYNIGWSFLSSPDFREIIQWSWSDENNINGNDILTQISRQKYEIEKYLSLFSELRKDLESYEDDKKFIIRFFLVINKDVTKEHLSNTFIPMFEKIENAYQLLYSNLVRADSPVGVNDRKVIAGIASIPDGIKEYGDQLPVGNQQRVQTFPFKELTITNFCQVAVVLSSVLYFLYVRITEK